MGRGVETKGQMLTIGSEGRGHTTKVDRRQGESGPGDRKIGPCPSGRHGVGQELGGAASLGCGVAEKGHRQTVLASGARAV